ncbi:hypothetical protein [Cloacibacillus sp. An23]|uniref:hypothetical protein n=1 Tax=Cloacibacillus sp. An23 TaxID=1965591 RepID=UPI000B38242A|nr:hypothetical protein [Cloacibacillus sp. An23]OUO90389.1 hypothetical protein B5F39_13785 [Cloacibacillus sp. An23]
MASIVARALVTVDAEKASKQDMELLKKLVMEFKDELDALGVKVDSLDKRVAVLEDNLGGWKIGGQFWFDANFAGGDQESSNYTEGRHDNDFQKDRIRFTLQKQISETTSFYAQFRAGSESAGAGTSGYGDVTQFNLRQVWVDTVLPWDINFRVGRFFLDFEDDHGLYVDNEPIYGDYRVDGFMLQKSWTNFQAKAIIGRNAGFEPGGWSSLTYDESDNEVVENVMNNYMTYALDLTWQPSENFFLGVNGVWLAEDGDVDYVSNSRGEGDYGDVQTYSVYAGYNFTPAIALQAAYYFQDLDNPTVNGNAYATLGSEDSPQAWKVILDLKQDLLKFTALRFEYMQIDNTFFGPNDPYSWEADSATGASIMDNFEYADPEGTSKLFYVRAEQKWNDKWSSYLQYRMVDYDTDWLDDAQNFGIGVTYQYTPAIAFRLAYDHVDYGDDNIAGYSDADHVFQFRTSINF